MKSIPSSLSSLKSKVDRLNIGKLETPPVDLSKLSNVIKNDVIKNTGYNAQVKNLEYKILNITNLATKTIHNAEVNEFKGEIPNITSVATTAAINVKISEVEGKISSTTNLASTNALTAVENKIRKVSNLVNNLLKHKN